MRPILAALCLAAALPAAAFVGDVCTTDADCPGGKCLTAAADGVPGGMCSVACGAQNACAQGQICIVVPDGNYCVPACTIAEPTCDATLCRAGLVCQFTGGGTAGACWAPCAADPDCGTGQTCDTTNGMCATTGSTTCTGTASQGCEATGCPAGEQCDPATHLCAHVANPTPVPVGAACTSDAACGTGGACIPELYPSGQSTGWAGGYCTSQCGPAFGTCPAGSACVAFSNGDFCLATCNDNTGCRGCGYVCDNRASTPGVCMPACTNAGYDCGQGEVCDPTIDLCTGTCPTNPCPAGWACDGGLCKNIQGCDTTGCPSNEYCSPQTNQCQLLGCEQVGCPTGQFCDASCHQCEPLTQGCEQTGCPAGQTCSSSTHLCGPDQSCEVVGCGCAQVCDHTTHQCTAALCQVTGQCPLGSRCDTGSQTCTCAAKPCTTNASCDPGEVCDPGSHTCYVPPGSTPPATHDVHKGCGCGAGAAGSLALALLAAALRRRRAQS